MSRIRTERLVNLVICLLSTRRFLTASQIAATVPGYEHDPDDARDHEAFQRKFERDKAELRELGVPLETGTASVFDTEPGYRIARREYALPDIPLTPDEAAAVGIAARLWQHAGLAAAASSGLAKLRAAGIEVDPQATLGVEPVVMVDAAFGPLTAAARERRTVAFDYRVPEHDAASTRRLQPWGVVCWRGRWYVVGHDLARAATRCFRLSRIVGAVRHTGPAGAYQIPAGVDLLSHVAGWFGPVEHNGRATVLVRPGRAAGVRRWALATGQPTGTAAGPEVAEQGKTPAGGQSAGAGQTPAGEQTPAGGQTLGELGACSPPRNPGSGRARPGDGSAPADGPAPAEDGRRATAARGGTVPDGDRMVLRYSDPEGLAAWLVRYGADVVVLDPPEVREAVIQRLKEVAARHEPPRPESAPHDYGRLGPAGAPSGSGGPSGPAGRSGSGRVGR